MNRKRKQRTLKPDAGSAMRDQCHCEQSEATGCAINLKPRTGAKRSSAEPNPKPETK